MAESNPVTLVSISPVHREALLELLCDETVTLTYMVPPLETEEKKNSMFRRLEELSHSPGRYIRAIQLSGKLIGIINDVGTEDGKIELGYAMLPRYWGHGYMTAALRTAINELAEAGFNRVECGAFETNEKSIAVMKRCGMKMIAETDRVSYRGTDHLCVYYALNIREKT